MNLRAVLGLGDHERVAFVGAGGKKTAMQRLLAERPGASICYTTTVHMPPPPGIPLVMLPPGTFESLERTRSGPIAVGSGSVDRPKRVPTKIRGFDPETIDRVANRDAFAWILVKADGARGRELTAPAAHEPPIPRSASTVVVVTSIQALGERVGSERIHRPEHIGAIAGLEDSDVLSLEDIARVVADPAGGLRNVPAGARCVLLVNKADSSPDRRDARQLVDAVADRADRYDRYVVASLRTHRFKQVEAG